MQTLDQYTVKYIDELRTTDGFHYLASPYMHEDHNVILDRANEAERAVAWLTLNDVVVFGAIHHSHSLVKYGLEGSWDCWKRIDTAFLSKCDGMIILGLTGWSRSKGVSAEIEYCLQHRKPIYLMRKKEGEESVFNYTIMRANTILPN